MKRKVIYALGLAMILACGTFMVGCGEKASTSKGNDIGAENEVDIEKDGIQMKNYLELYTEGQNGYAKLYADIDFRRLKNDCKMYLKENVNEINIERPSYDTVDEYLEHVFRNIDTYDIVTCDNYQNLSNGDTCEVTVEIPEYLSEILTVDVSEARFSYEVEGLEEFEPLDPFKHVKLTFDELISTGNQVGYKLRDYASAAVVLPDGTPRIMNIFCAIDENKTYTLEDTVRVFLSAESIENYKEEFGDDIFAKKEAEVQLKDVIGYLPDGEDAKEIFEVMDDACLANVEYSVKRLMDTSTDTYTKVEVVGMMLYYDEEGKLEEGDDKYYNQIVFICKMTNDVVPQGWYTYMANNGGVYIVPEINKGTVQFEKCVLDISGTHMMDDFRYYENEHPKMVNNNYPASFDFDGTTYPGHMDIEDVFKALEANVSILKEYDHLVVSDSLKDYVEEY